MSLPNSPTVAVVAGKLLADAATFFDKLGDENAQLKEQMAENASVFRQMGDLLTKDPKGSLDGNSYGELAGKLLVDAAAFFRTLGEQNAGLKEQMSENATVFEHVGKMVKSDPLGVLSGDKSPNMLGAFNRARS